MGQFDNVKVYLSHCRMVNAWEEYCTLNKNLASWEYNESKSNVDLAEYNSGSAEAMRKYQFVVYIGRDLQQMKEATKAMQDTLNTGKLKAKGLINCCDDFVNILRGESAESLSTYCFARKGATDILYFNDKYAKQDSGYSGLIKDYTDIVSDRSDDESQCLEDIEEALSHVKSVTVSISDEKNALQSNITKQKRVNDLYDTLVLFGDGVLDFNDYISENMEPYVYEPWARNHLRNYTYDDEETQNDTFIQLAIRSALAEYGVTPSDIEAAEKMGFTPESLLAYYDSFAGDKSRDCFTNVLRQNYDEAFTDVDYSLLNDDNLMTALAEYSINIIQVDENGDGTPESCQQFVDFINGIMVADLGYNYAPFEEHPSSQILMKLHSQTEVLAQADSIEVAAIDPNSPGYSERVIRVNKEVAICNFYNVEYASLKDNWGYEGSQGVQNHYAGPMDQFKTTIANFSFNNNEITFNNVNYNGEYEVHITCVTDPQYGQTVIMDATCKELEDDYRELLGTIFINAAETTTTAVCTGINPCLGAAVKLILAFQSGDFSKDVDATYKLISEYDKLRGGTPTPGLSDTISISAQALEDAYNYYKHINDSDAAGKAVSAYLFGYTYESTFEEDSTAAYIGSWLQDSQVTDQYSTSMTKFVRPEGYVTMGNIEQKGILEIAKENLSPEEYDYLVKRLEDKADNIENKKMANMILYGYDPESGEKLDFSTVDYSELMDTIRDIDTAWHAEGHNTTVELLIRDDMNNVRNTYERNQAAAAAATSGSGAGTNAGTAGSTNQAAGG